MLNELRKKDDTVLRILCKDENDVLVVNCTKKTMPIWISEADICSYTPISEAELLTVIGNIPPDESLDNRQIKVMHERFTMIVDILSVLGNEQKRSLLIREASKECKVTPETIRSYLILYLIYQDIRALAPKKKGQGKELSKDEKNMRWALNKFFYTKKKNSLRSAYACLINTEEYLKSLFLLP